MSTSLPSAGRPTYYTIREAAWILCVKPQVIARAIRVGTLRTERRRGRMLIPADAVRAMLGTPTADAQMAGGVH
jgi:excisionase family DNA binding protein